MRLPFLRLIIISAILGGIFCLDSSCKNGNSESKPVSFSYEEFRDSLRSIKPDTSTETGNVLDKEFNPATDSLEILLMSMDTIWDHDLQLLSRIDTFIKGLKKTEKFTPEEIAAVRENVRMLDSFLKNRDNPDILQPCRDTSCILYAEVKRSSQTLYLRIGGELKDSFPVSTGMKKFETPDIAQHPRGPLFVKYNSKKFPGGNYKGLGNMPYAVFISGGYAIHGTTVGNFKKLGKPASHGCIRLHPDNAYVFYELVKRIGIANTWVVVKE